MPDENKKAGPWPGFILSEIYLLRYYQPESISVNIHDFNVGIFLKVFPEFGNINIHAPSIEIGIAAPYFLQGRFPLAAGHFYTPPAFSATHFPWGKVSAFYH